MLVMTKYCIFTLLFMLEVAYFNSMENPQGAAFPPQREYTGETEHLERTLSS